MIRTYLNEKILFILFLQMGFNSLPFTSIVYFKDNIKLFPVLLENQINYFHPILFFTILFLMLYNIFRNLTLYPYIKGSSSFIGIN